MTQLNNRIALVTGAGSGIGASTALLLAKEGAHVCCADLRHSAADATAHRAIEEGYRASSFAQHINGAELVVDGSFVL